MNPTALAISATVNGAPYAGTATGGCIARAFRSLYYESGSDMAHFEQACEQVTKEDVADSPLPLGPDVDRHVGGIKQFLDAGYTHVYVHQVGPDQDGFLRFYESELLPRYARVAAASWTSSTPASSRTFTCLEIAGLDTPKPAVASPTVAGPAPRRSSMPIESR